MKPNSQVSNSAFLQLSSFISEKYSGLDIFVEKEVAQALKLPYLKTVENSCDYSDLIDLIITLGGDGTILHAASLFQNKSPPILSFSLGTLGFLLPFDFKNYKSAFSSVLSSKATVLNRMRLQCTFKTSDGSIVKQALNELTLHRGHSPSLCTISIFINNQYLTDAIADGLIISTPTGSTAYNLSAGGPLLHPTVPGIIINPISPRSLSFRPLVVPDNVELKLVVGVKGDKNKVVYDLKSGRLLMVDADVDGINVASLKVGDEVTVKISEFPTPCVMRVNSGVDWVKDLNSQLKWNQVFKGFGNRS
ncbi:NADH kinase pos5 [Nowakowskiella sp. JEL0078]|nr:NADH kinase pos5 [Nowakowskiella sp. JEL0078]